MYNTGPPPPYESPPYAPPGYSQTVGGVPPASPFTSAETCMFYFYFVQLHLYIKDKSYILKNWFVIDTNGPTIVTTIVPLGPGSTHTICPHCHAEIDTTTKTEPGMIAYISGVVIALMGYLEIFFLFINLISIEYLIYYYFL